MLNVKIIAINHLHQMDITGKKKITHTVHAWSNQKKNVILRCNTLLTGVRWIFREKEILITPTNIII